MKSRQELTDEELKQELMEALSNLPKPNRARLWLDLLSFRLIGGVEDLVGFIARTLGMK